ncbi:LysR family transcriptional regulator, glycine cleavage system transcriptional activator [Sphingobium sp. AP50]|uniref:LysR family transcriptional regulator n=1 Tax=Sphingobium sp. AP50 TaxID=1884369 RepID=UPI0008B58EAB|nr:LysR family transcriptional regulator [Sphingobium sp. AP50]SEJ95582.1 LysR family transcriptional regulator, glycine cleavage system transcriptional activator [Sphingobium sp. AP50]
MKRTHLPLNALRVLDAAARHLSFTRAADELAVTPAAVGQQIRALEDMLGVMLFRRTPKRLELTPETEAGLDALRAGFLAFEEAVRAMQASLTIAATHYIIDKWLQPRLATRTAGALDSTLALVMMGDALDLTKANLDPALRLSASAIEHEGDARGELLFVTVEAQAGGPDARIEWPGCPHTDQPSAICVSDAGLAIEAAANGLGRATVPHMLAHASLAAGRVRQLGEPVSVGVACRLIKPLPQWRQTKPNIRTNEAKLARHSRAAGAPIRSVRTDA